MAKDNKPKIAFQYKVAPEYRLYSITGVHGGLNAKGDVIANFFSERGPIPKRVTHEIDVQTGSLIDPPIEVESTEDIIRNVYCGMAITPADARSIGKWFIDKADQFDKHVLPKGKKI